MNVDPPKPINLPHEIKRWTGPTKTPGRRDNTFIHARRKLHGNKKLRIHPRPISLLGEKMTQGAVSAQYIHPDLFLPSAQKKCSHSSPCCGPRPLRISLL